MPTSQNGWPAATGYSGHGIPLVPLRWVTGSVRSGDVHYLFDSLGAWFNQFVERIDAGSSWGFAPREIRGSSTSLSNHASGTAVDFNAPRHPLGRTGTFSSTQARIIRAKLHEWGGVIRWGGDYAGRKDEMHFEINAGSSTTATVARQVRQHTLEVQDKLRDLGYYHGARDGAPGPVYSDALYRFQSDDPTLAADGVFGPASERSYRSRRGDSSKQTPTEGFLMALSDAQQKMLFDKVVKSNEALGRIDPFFRAVRKDSKGNHHRALDTGDGNTLRNDIARVEATVRAQSAALEALAKSVGVDPEQVQATVKTAVENALADITLTLTTANEED